MEPELWRRYPHRHMDYYAFFDPRAKRWRHGRTKVFMSKAKAMGARKLGRYWNIIRRMKRIQPDLSIAVLRTEARKFRETYGFLSPEEQEEARVEFWAEWLTP